MRVVNGFTVIAAEKSWDGCLIILGARESAYSHSGFEYVTAAMMTNSDSEWWSGHYFNNLETSVSDFWNRVNR